MTSKIDRPSWLQTWFSVLETLAERATCPRLHTACLIVDRNNRVLGMGYNGSPAGQAHCTEVGCLMEDGHCVRTIHDTANALYQAGPAAEGATMYQLFRPCLRCINLMIAYKVRHLVYRGNYGSDDEQLAFRVATAGGIMVYCLDKESFVVSLLHDLET